MPTELKILIILFIIAFILAFTFAMCTSAKKSDEAMEKDYKEFLKKKENLK